jgi:nucleoside-diphosphate-sugar epimerase
LHLRAMTHPAAKGERFLGVAGDFMSVGEIAKVLRARLGAAARRVPTREVPNWLVRLVALVEPATQQILPELGRVKNGTGDKARRLLGWAPRSREDAIAATGESLLRFGLLKDGAKKAA